MEFRVEMAKVTASTDSITIWDAKRIHAHRGNPHHNILLEAINQMGEGSRRAQGLSQVLTSLMRLQTHVDHRLYMLCQGRCSIGILKVGTKKLFVRNEIADMKEIEPLCVLDFYVHEKAQRSGFGKILYEHMLLNENILPHQLAYDRPSPKLLSFLANHYKLSAYVPQTNNFVVFNAYFDSKYKSFFGAVDPPIPIPRAALGPALPAAEENSPPPQPRAAPVPQQQQLKSSQLRQNTLPLLVPGGSQAPSRPNIPTRREPSPTRSGSTYNIITLQEGAPGPNSLCAVVHQQTDNSLNQNLRRRVS